MSAEYIIGALILAVVVFAGIYWWLYQKYRNVDKKYEVVQNTATVTLSMNVQDSFHKKRKELESKTIDGENLTNYTDRVKRIEHT